MDHFLADVLRGLQSHPKYLDSKYFYDKRGDELFQKIMASDEYYLTNCEREILTQQTSNICDAALIETGKLDVIEFGAGDATKSIFLLKEFCKRKAIANYFPIDISGHIIDLLEKNVPEEIPGLNIHGLEGEYFEMLAKANEVSKNRKLVLFLGANIGNFKFDAMPSFCKKLRHQLIDGDLVLIGFDLKKNPRTIRAAYDDSMGYTSQFNLNLLRRINEELHADFDTTAFEHYAMYDPDSGACKSYLVSRKKQDVHLDGRVISFEANETIFMEISQKYTVSQVDEIAVQSGFVPVSHFFDTKKYFVDVIWKCGNVVEQ